MNNTEIRTGVIRPVECVKEGWELIKSNYWILFAIFFVGVIIGSFSLYILLGAMTCGIFYCYLQAIDGKSGFIRRSVERIRFFQAGFDRYAFYHYSDNYREFDHLSAVYYECGDGSETQRRRIDRIIDRRVCG